MYNLQFVVLVDSDCGVLLVCEYYNCIFYVYLFYLMLLGILILKIIFDCLLFYFFFDKISKI